MATLKQRVHRMNSSGSYDTIYYETSSEVVIRPDGTTVESAINSIAESSGNPAELWVWERFNYTPQNYSLDTSISNQVLSDNTSGNTGVNITVQYSSNIEVAKDGTVRLSGTISTLTISDNNTGAATTLLRGKYCKYSTNTIGTIPSKVKNSVFFLPDNATISYEYYRYSSSSPYYYRLKASLIQFVTGTSETKVHDSFLCSIDGTTYPTDSQSGNYWYTRLGQIGESFGGAKIETGSYVGTGTYGSSNPNSLTFGFAPKLFSIYGAQSSSFPYGLWALYDGNTDNHIIPFDILSTSYTKGFAPSVSDDTIESVYAKKSVDGKTVSWYGPSDRAQNNTSAVRYFYFAIG